MLFQPRLSGMFELFCKELRSKEKVNTSEYWNPNKIQKNNKLTSSLEM